MDEAESHKVDLIVVGGDVVAGPLPSETLTRIQKIETPTQFIRGNAESEVLRYLNDEEINGLSERADEEARWVAGQLSSDEIEMIESWGQTITLEIDHVGKILFCHGTPQSDIDVFTKLTPEEKLLPVFEDVMHQL